MDNTLDKADAAYLAAWRDMVFHVAVERDA